MNKNGQNVIRFAQSATGFVERLSSEITTLDAPPKIIIRNALPNSYDVISYGSAYYYRRNESLNPEVVTIENDPILSGQTKAISGNRADCCKLAIVGIDVRTPNGQVVPVFGNYQPPTDDTCLVQEVLVLEASNLKSGKSLSFTLKVDS